MQASAATFSATPLGHKFVLRTILAKATANRCADCSEDIRAHSRGEVTDAQLLAVLNAQDDGKASVIVPGELSVGSYKAALRVCKAAAPTECVLNCAGHKLHDFLPPTRAGFDKLRSETPPRLYDLEWEDSEAFEIKLEEVLSALAWAREQVASGLHVVVNCAQGKSRSGLMAATKGARNEPVELTNMPRNVATRPRIANRPFSGPMRPTVGIQATSRIKIPTMA